MKIAIVISFLLNVLLLYRVFDMGVTITHQSEQGRFLNSQLSDVEKLWTKQMERMLGSTLRELANQVGIEVSDKRTENAIYLGRVKVLLSDDRVVRVVFRE